jgi:hypothetical protein
MPALSEAGLGTMSGSEPCLSQGDVGVAAVPHRSDAGIRPMSELRWCRGGAMPVSRRRPGRIDGVEAILGFAAMSQPVRRCDTGDARLPPCPASIELSARVFC